MSPAPEPTPAVDLTWPGRAAAGRLADPAAPMVLHDRGGVPATLAATGHHLLVGDNLQALRALRHTHQGAFRLIYIDPPYNEGTDYLYADTRRHAAWLDLMLPRLLLARDLLAPNGVLFASIGDAELAHLRLCGEHVFGAEHFLGTVTRVTKRTSNKGTHFAPSTDFLLGFARDRRRLPPFHDVLDAEYAARFRGEDAHGRFATVALFQNALDPRPNQRYWIECPDGSLVIPPGPTLPAELRDGACCTPQGPADRVWRWSVATYLERRDRLVWKRSARSPLRTPSGERSPWNVHTKYYLHERLASGRRPRDFLDDLTNDQGTADLKALGLDDCFPFAKPVALVQRLLVWIADPTALVLDFFGGSGTTGEAVLRQNATDGGTRRCVLVQEALPTGRADFPTIADVCAERVARAAARLGVAAPFRRLTVAAHA